MSELKAFTFGLGQYMEDGSPCVVAFDGEKNPRLASDEKFYLKSEADKFISDLEESHKTEVKELLCLIRDKENNFNRAFDSEEKELRHQKHKRCLDKAKLCESEEKRLEAIAPIFDTDKECWEYNSDYWDKWRNRWLELSEKFKTNSTAK